MASESSYNSLSISKIQMMIAADADLSDTVTPFVMCAVSAHVIHLCSCPPIG
jgi:hypothetical protein